MIQRAIVYCIRFRLVFRGSFDFDTYHQLGHRNDEQQEGSSC